MNICPVGAKLIHADGRHDEANNHFSQFWNAQEKQSLFCGIGISQGSRGVWLSRMGIVGLLGSDFGEALQGL